MKPKLYLKEKGKKKRVNRNEPEKMMLFFDSQNNQIRSNINLSLFIRLYAFNYITSSLFSSPFSTSNILLSICFFPNHLIFYPQSSLLTLAMIECISCLEYFQEKNSKSPCLFHIKSILKCLPYEYNAFYIIVDKIKKKENEGHSAQVQNIGNKQNFIHFSVEPHLFPYFRAIFEQQIQHVTVDLNYTQYYLMKYRFKLVQSMQSLKNFFVQPPSIRLSDNETYENFRSYAYSPLEEKDIQLDQKTLNQKAKQIFEWAIKNGAKYYTFFGFPQTQGVLQKQETLLDLSYFYDYTLKNTGKSSFGFLQLGKGEGDGSSFPSGGLRQTHKARAYTVWDQKSDVFLRQKNNVLYIPALLVTHYGQALDDKTIFRKAEMKLQESSLTLLRKLGRNATAVTMALGLEQEFFVMSKQDYDKRLDLKTTGRAIIGKTPPKHQQFSDHYYGKLPAKIQQALRSAEKQLLEIGVPCKTRHKEVGPNQFEFCPLFQEAGKSIDHNMILMQILKETFEEKQLKVLLHEKPFANMNGSGKHCNWSLNYIDESGNIQNLFKIPTKKEEVLLFRLFILIQLKALIKHSKLYLTAVSPSGNELRLGGHEAPPRIISAFLGSTVSQILDNEEPHEKLNLKEQIPNLNFNVYQEDTDRNRTSPYAYTGNKFEFRAVGSSQNVSFVMAVIAATIAKETEEVTKRLDQGEKIEKIMAQLHEETKAVRFSGNGYSPEWIDEAKKRGLYVNENFYENLLNYKDSGKVFADLGICRETEIQAKFQNMIGNYENTVKTESACLQSILGSQIIPRCYEFLKLLEPESRSTKINKRSNKFIQVFERLIDDEQTLKEYHKKAESLQQMAELRKIVEKVALTINETLQFLPKKDSWPEYEDFINKY